MVQIKLLIQSENIYVGRMLLHSVLLLFTVGIFHIYSMKITMFILTINVIFPLKELKM